MKKRILYQSILVILVIIVILFYFKGLSDRISDKPDFLWSNTPNFFYKRAYDYHLQGSYPSFDNYSLSPLSVPEDYPPLLPHLSVNLYKILRLFNIQFETYILYFPVIVYTLLFFSGFFLIKKLFNYRTALIFVCLIVITPLSKHLTSKGYYTTESLGLLFTFFFIYCFIRLQDKKLNILFCSLWLTLLILTWQMFVFIYVFIIISLIIHYKNKKLLTKYILLLIVPLIFSHLISVYFFNIGYSPFLVFKELYIGVISRNTPDFIMAFNRYKLTPITLQSFIKDFTIFNYIFLMIGLFGCFNKIKCQKYQHILVIGGLSIISLLIFHKYRFIAMIGVMIISSIGVDFLVSIYKWNNKRKNIILLLIILLLSITLGNYFLSPRCVVELQEPIGGLSLNKSYNTTFILKNEGSDAYYSKNKFEQNKPFSGLHFEIENAIVSNITLNNKTYKPHIRNQNIYWYEVGFSPFNSGEINNITVTFIPLKLPVKIYYRCWIPQYCDLKSPSGLKPQYSVPWRNEKCLHRMPTKGILCKVPVFAGYTERKDFYCKYDELY